MVGGMAWNEVRMKGLVILRLSGGKDFALIFPPSNLNLVSVSGMVYLDESERVNLEDAAQRFHGQWSRYLHSGKIPKTLDSEGIIEAVDSREDG